MRDNVRNEYFRLLKEWLDALLSCVVNDPAHPSLDGAVLCPACTLIHGRCHEAIYPLLTMADLTRETKYLEAARKLFRWSSYMLCDDGSMYNDSQSAWSGTTVFAAISLVKALSRHGHLLAAEEKRLWEKRLLEMALWLEDGVTPEKKCNINYIAANAAAMALIGRYFGQGAMLARAKRSADFVFQRVSESGLVYGEGSLERSATPRGGCAVDIGYSVEETLPSLFDYVQAAGDERGLSAVREAARAHLDLMLPDGAWDNSFGSRNFKWTYWGSRTADGCQAMLNALGKSEPMFAEAAYRNLLLYKRCTDGLLYGGPHYQRHGELPCVHHAFCHAKALAQALDEGVAEFIRAALPSDEAERVKYYPEIETFRLSCGDWRLTVCAGDFPYMKGGHASGGAVTLLWHRGYGPVIAAANTDFSLREPMNQQLTRRKKLHGSLCPRLEKKKNGTVYSQVYDRTAAVAAQAFPDHAAVRASGVLCDISHQASAGGEAYVLEYTLTKQSLSIKGGITAGEKTGASFILPLICPADHKPVLFGRSALIHGRLRVVSASDMDCAGPVFNLAPGFEAVNLSIYPGEDGLFDFSIAMEDA
ncbi:MAG: hypothetical protein IKQ41_00325 [Clostridia bacterium]|nr:hypothetical protein [Clostridia bacterium]